MRDAAVVAGTALSLLCLFSACDATAPPPPSDPAPQTPTTPGAEEVQGADSPDDVPVETVEEEVDPTGPPPEPDLTGVDDLVVASMRAARAAVEAAPESAAAWGELGAVFDVHGMFGPATTCYRRAIRLDPGEFAWTYLLAVVRDVHGADADEVARLFGRALELDPDYVPAWFRLGHALSLRGRLPEAERALAEALARDPELSVAHREYGQVLLAQGEPERALDALRRAQELNPRDGSVRSAIAVALGRLGDVDAARAAAREAGELETLNDLRDPVHARLVASKGASVKHLLERAEYLLNRGDPRAALQALEPIPLDAPGHAGELMFAHTLYLNGAARRNLGDAPTARRLLLRAVEVDPRHVGAQIELGALDIDEGLYDSALSRFEEAARLDPGDPLALSGLAQLQAGTGDDASAVASYERLARVAAPTARDLMNWGNVLTRLGRLEPAIAKYRAALEIEPEYANAHYNLAAALERVGRRGDALEHYREAVRIDPSHPAGRAVRRLGG